MKADRIHIKENSFIARIACLKMGSKAIAMVLGKTIHLYGVSKAEFLSNPKWVRHELKHVEQYAKMGTIPFLWAYLLESVKKGYQNNRFEVEAREAEEDWG